QHLAAGVDVPALRERDQMLREWPERLGLRLGRADPFVGEELRRERAHEQALVRWPGPEPGPLPRSRPLVLPEGQAELVELPLDLVDRLLPEVADVHQLGLALLPEVADGVDALALQAVVGPDGEVQLLDRDRVIAAVLLVGLRLVGDHALALGQ